MTVAGRAPDVEMSCQTDLGGQTGRRRADQQPDLSVVVGRGADVAGVDAVMTNRDADPVGIQAGGGSGAFAGDSGESGDGRGGWLLVELFGGGQLQEVTVQQDADLVGEREWFGMVVGDVHGGSSTVQISEATIWAADRAFPPLAGRAAASQERPDEQFATTKDRRVPSCNSDRQHPPFK